MPSRPHNTNNCTLFVKTRHHSSIRRTLTTLIQKHCSTNQHRYNLHVIGLFQLKNVRYIVTKIYIYIYMLFNSHCIVTILLCWCNSYILNQRNGVHLGSVKSIKPNLAKVFLKVLNNDKD